MSAARIVSANVRRLAARRGIALAHLADRAGVGRTTMWRLLDVNERGPSDPRLSTIESLARALGVRVVELMEEGTMRRTPIEVWKSIKTSQMAFMTPEERSAAVDRWIHELKQRRGTDTASDWAAELLVILAREVAGLESYGGEREYYLASRTHTLPREKGNRNPRRLWVNWWAADCAGYDTNLRGAGRYQEARLIADPWRYGLDDEEAVADTLAVPVYVVERLAKPLPAGELVVPNTPGTWQTLRAVVLSQSPQSGEQA